MNAHLLIARHVGPTDTKGSRVRLTSQRFERDTVMEGCDRDCNGTFENARKKLTVLGYTEIRSGEMPEGYWFAVAEFQPLRESVVDLRMKQGSKQGGAK